MSETYQGGLDGRGLRVAIVAARFNETVTRSLLDGAREGLVRLGVDGDAIDLAWTPGCFEIPLVARRMADMDRYDAVICLGAVIRGATPHFDYVASEAASGLQLAALETGVPVSFGVLTTETVEQARERVGKGAEAVRSALEMADVFAQLRAAAAR